MFNGISNNVGGVVWSWAMFVSLERQTSRICEGREACPAAKWYWRPLNSKRSLPVLKWTSESEYFLGAESSPRAIT